MERVKHGRRVDGVIGRLFEESFASAGDEFGNGRFGKLTVERVGDSAKSWQEHTTLAIWAIAQAIFDWNTVAVGTDEFGSRHVAPPDKVKAPTA